MKNKETDTELESRLLEILVHPCRIEDIRRELPNAGKNNLKNALDALVADGRVMKNKKNRFAVSAHYGCAAGTYLATERAFAFVAPDYPEGEAKPDDLFIPPNASGGAWHGDRVLVKVSERKNNRGRKEATVIRVLGRAGKELTGELVQRGKAFFVQPTSKKYPEIAVDKHDLGEAAVGDCVAVSISHYGDEQFMPQGVVRVDLGESGTMEAAIAAVLHENGVYDVFPNEVLEQALAIPQEVDMGTAGKRLDLRDKLIFTIDGDDAKDFDDAVSLEKLENGHYLLGVHIADVSHYVTPDSPLDAEAFRRGTSVYFPGHVVPMLPFALSNGICSLNPKVDRLAFSALLEVDKDGRRYGAKFGKSVICSKARMTYNKVNKILAGDKEAEIRVDENGKPVEIRFRERGESEKLIEEFMLQANEAVAEYMCKRELPTVYRVHENPDPDKLRVFASFARPFGYRIDPSKPEDTAQFQTVLRGAKNDPKQRVLPTLLLRSLARARYADECIGHYGLKAKFYLHFTSPIRRYPDLVAHRMLQKALLGEEFTAADETMCEEAADQSTNREQAADNCERRSAKNSRPPTKRVRKGRGSIHHARLAADNCACQSARSNDPKQRVLPTLLLRSLARARYADECIGHYGLKAKFYLHFTSPIRRYPDLVAHRMLQKALLGEEFTTADETMCEEAADQSTNREQAADNCERDINKLYIASYMQQFIGEEFDAEVSGVQSFGVFVALENGGEGLIRAELMTGDFYQYDEEHMAMVGRHTGKRFTIGTPMRVKLLAASDTTGQIDFAPADGSLPVSEKLDRPRREDTDRAPRGNRAERRRHSGKGRGGKPGKGKKPPTRKRR